MDSINIYSSFQSSEVQVAKLPRSQVEVKLNTEKRDTASSSNLLTQVSAYLETPPEIYFKGPEKVVIISELTKRQAAALGMTAALSPICLFSGLLSLINGDLVNGLVLITFGVGFLAMLARMVGEKRR